jgi:hypothetical protein
MVELTELVEIFSRLLAVVFPAWNVHQLVMAMEENELMVAAVTCHVSFFRWMSQLGKCIDYGIIKEKNPNSFADTAKATACIQPQ